MTAHTWQDLKQKNSLSFISLQNQVDKKEIQARSIDRIPQ